MAVEIFGSEGSHGVALSIVNLIITQVFCTLGVVPFFVRVVSAN